MNNLTTRYAQLDFMRGTAIILMLIFHFSFNLNHFKFISIDIYHGAFWHYFRYVIVSLFLLCVGISLYLSNHKGINIQKNARRFTLLTVASLAITLVTWLIFPKSWVYFGVLHFIAIASVLGLLFVRHPTIGLLLGLSIILGWNIGILHMHGLYSSITTYIPLPQRTEDLVPLTPWFGVVLVGIFAGHQGIFRFVLPGFKYLKPITFLGRHALVIYLAHQPVLFGLTFLGRTLLG